jgi:hypothetical protein
MVRDCKRLSLPALPGCTRLMDCSIHAIADHCPALGHQDARDRTLVRAAARKLLLRMCTKLYRV